MKINKNDYRLLYFEPIKDKESLLKSLKDSIDYSHNISDYHSFLNNKTNNEHRTRFSEIFNLRCCYCGASFNDLFNLENLEIDHILSKTSDLKKATNVNDILNLCPSCHDCNSSKKDIVMTKEEAELINPYSSIHKLFYRDTQLYIRIKNDYADNCFVNTFYKKLGLYSEKQRLFYILIVLSKMKQKYFNSESSYNTVNKCYDLIKSSLNYSIRSKN